ncbi:MAG: hypothetical protein LBD84_02985 [Campylobacteraceae bacterium]|jgi:hypothetical protein|nr:hypothetical protein [Campylobacteraceae bacterium]
MAVSTTKINALSLFKLKVLSIFLSLLIGFFLVGCSENEDDEGEYKYDGGAKYSISFFDSNLDIINSVKESGNVNITAIAKELGINGAIYAASGKPVVLGSYDLTEDVNFYTIGNVKEVSTQEDLHNVRGDLSGKYVLVQDIELDASGAGFDGANGWNPLSTFTGIFNGNFHKITNLWIERTTNQIGLFGVVDNAQIKNLGVEIAEGKEAKGEDYVGGIAGHIEGSSSIVNSYVAGDVRGDNAVGGIAGRLTDTVSIKNSYSMGNIRGSQRVGGIAGLLLQTASIRNSYSTADVSGTNNYVGGIVGGADDSGNFVRYSYSSGNVNGASSVGGIAGWNAANVSNNAAINPSVVGTGNNRKNRIAGSSSGTASDNIARNALSSDFSDFVDGNKYSGTGKDDGAFFLQSTYENLGWVFGESNDAPWKIDEGESLPYFYWQKL